MYEVNDIIIKIIKYMIDPIKQKVDKARQAAKT
jgi:hypothetical protein